MIWKVSALNKNVSLQSGAQISQISQSSFMNMYCLHVLEFIVCKTVSDQWSLCWNLLQPILITPRFEDGLVVKVKVTQRFSHSNNLHVIFLLPNEQIMLTERLSASQIKYLVCQMSPMQYICLEYACSPFQQIHTPHLKKRTVPVC